MKLIDTHAHIYLEAFEGEVDQIVKKARKAQVESIYLPNIDVDTIPRMLQLVASYPGCFYPMVGLHPGSVFKDYAKQLRIIEGWLDQRPFSAIGEIGIDLYWDKTYRKEQEEAFEIQVKWAQDRSMPVVIHSRDAFEEIFRILDKQHDEKLFGIFHSFSGTIEEAQHIIDLGFNIGINGIVTFKNASLDQVIRQIDLKHIVLETDSPYLAPEPKRGKRNESAYLRYIAEKIAGIKNIPLEEVAEITTRNAYNVLHGSP